MSRIYKRNGWWCFDTTIRHQRIRKKVGPTKKLAEDALRKFEIEAIMGKLDLAKEEPEMVFETLITSYLDTVSKVKKAPVSGYRRDKIIFNHFTRLFPEVRLVKEISLKLGYLYCAYRKNDGVVNSTINREIATYKAMFNYAVDCGDLKENPWAKLKKLPSPKMSKPFLEPDEALQLLEASKTLGTNIHLFIFIAIYTAMRRGEIFNLKWSDVDWKRNLITVNCDSETRTKSNKYRVIELEKDLKEILWAEKLKQEFTSAYIISNNGSKAKLTDIKNSFKVALSKTKITKHVTPKTLRTTACSFWAMRGVPLKQAQEWMGHSDVNLTANIYSQIVSSLKDNYLNSISGIFEETKTSIIKKAS